ncbi:MAG TPA: prolyl oligopeptidase family serine peptidase [Gemmatimonadaceae bacterium]|nr:prolyl oligopeptidase family serine peptidase [Gemmatimonadaceae bacterium]
MHTPRHFRVIFPVALAVAAAAPLPLVAQQGGGPGFELTIPNIMRGPEVYGREPGNVRWTADSRWLYFSWNPPGTDWRADPESYRVRAAAGSAPEKVTPAQMDSVGPLLVDGPRSADGRSRVVSYSGDLYLVDLRTGTARQLTDTNINERDPHFSADGKRVYFLRDGMNVMSFDLAQAEVTQVTDIREGPPPRRDTSSAKGQRGALERQQLELFQVLRDREREDSIRQAARTAREAQQMTALYLNANERVAQLDVSPAGNAALVVTFAPTRDSRSTIVPAFVTESGYTEDLNVRTKVGDAQSVSRVAFVRLPSGEATWLDILPDSGKETPSARLLGWNSSGTAALIYAERSDYKARFIQLVTADGEVRTLDTLRDSAWVGGPCSSCGGWYDGDKRAWFVSEADGYAHIYSVNADGGDRRQLTSGKWEVLDAQLSPDGKFFELHTSEVSPFERHFYRMPVAGGAMQRITTKRGGHTVTPSPDGKLLADVFSEANRPPELFVLPYRAGAEMAQLTTSPTADWLAFNWIVPEIVNIPASDGVQVPARIYRPADVGAQPNGAAVIFVHGAGYLHNVHNYWSSYSREYMFNHLLASSGYVVLDIDYRGSAGYGRDWRTAIYRWMGGRDLADQVDGSRWLQKEFGIDPERIGLYGGSYGGFITLMALFTAPDDFGAGAALRSVTDWAHYNHGYTARILNQPQDDTLAYRRSSPIFFAEGLEDPLLIAHGMVDTNVHFQDVVRLSQRLIELGKTGWEMALYPVENHGFVRPDSWTDEYRRIFELFERHLPARATVGGNGTQR